MITTDLIHTHTHTSFFTSSTVLKRCICKTSRLRDTEGQRRPGVIYLPQFLAPSKRPEGRSKVSSCPLQS